MSVDHCDILRAAEWIHQAEAILLHTGAGMGVDAGLPTFRGREGLWKAYPPLKHLGLDFASLANPRWFRHNPRLAWGFYGHRLHQYRNTQPHAGFDIIRQWGRRKPLAAMTSNVDGLLHAADFPLIWEIHGRIREFQCSTPCGAHTWSGDEYTPHIDNNTLHEQDMLPECPHCGAIARPNILMFSDASWVSDLSNEQEQAYDLWLQQQASKNIVIIEIGAGTAVPSVRMHSEWVNREYSAKLIRINSDEPQVPSNNQHSLGIAGGAVEVLKEIDESLLSWGS